MTVADDRVATPIGTSTDEHAARRLLRARIPRRERRLAAGSAIADRLAADHARSVAAAHAPEEKSVSVHPPRGPASRRDTRAP